MMKKNNLYTIGAVALGLAAAFFVYRKFVNGKKLNQPVAPEPVKDLDENPLTSTIGQVGSTRWVSKWFISVSFWLFD